MKECTEDEDGEASISLDTVSFVSEKLNRHVQVIWSSHHTQPSFVLESRKSD